MSNEQNNEIAVSTGVTDLVTNYNDEFGTGFEDTDSGDLQIPYAKLLQSLSPEVKKGDERVEGAEEGMIYLPSTGQMFGDEGVVIVPVYLDKATIEWAPRDSGGGYVGRRDWNDRELLAQIEEGKSPKDWVSDAGNKLARTYYLWAVVIDPNDPENLSNFAIFSFDSMKIKGIQQWITRAKQATIMVGETRKQVPMFHLLTRIKTKMTKNAKGEFFVYTLEFANTQDGSASGWKDAVLSTDDPRTSAAIEFRRQIASGLAKAENPDAAGDPEHTEEDPF